MPQDIWDCQNLGGLLKILQMHRAAPHQNYPTRNVNRTEEARFRVTKSALGNRVITPIDCLQMSHTAETG